MATCSVCYPVIYATITCKFEGEKAPIKVGLTGWQQCNEEAVQEISDFIDPTKPGTLFTLYRCEKHKKA